MSKKNKRFNPAASMDSKLEITKILKDGIESIIALLVFPAWLISESMDKRRHKRDQKAHER